MDNTLLLKALADETRMKLMVMLLHRDFCGKALARRAGVSEAAVSQHMKVLREAGLIVGEKQGYQTHYRVNRHLLRELAGEMEDMAATEQQACTPEEGGCHGHEAARCQGRRGRGGKGCGCHDGHGEGHEGKGCGCRHEESKER